MVNKKSKGLIRVELSRLDQLMEHGQLDAASLAGLLERMDAGESEKDMVDHIAWEKKQKKDNILMHDLSENDKKNMDAPDLSLILNMLRTYQQQSKVDESTEFFHDFHDYDKHSSGWVYTIMTYSRHLDKIFYIDFNVKQHEAFSNKIQRILEEDIFKKGHIELYESLTKREKEVLRLISLGESNQEISDKLFLSKDTVRTHRNHIWKKLKINTLVDAIKYAQAFDLI